MAKRTKKRSTTAWSRIESAIGAVAKGHKGARAKAKKAIKDYALHSCAVKMGRKGGTVTARKRKAAKRGRKRGRK